MPSLGPARLTITSEPSEISQTKMSPEPEVIPRTFVAAKIARLNHSASQKKNSPIVLRKPSLNQKTKRPYGHVAKREYIHYLNTCADNTFSAFLAQTTKQYTLEEFKQMNVTFHQTNGIV